MEYEQGEPYYPRGNPPFRQNYVSLRNKKGKINNASEQVVNEKAHPVQSRLFSHAAEGDRSRQDGDYISDERDPLSNGGFTLYSPMTEIKSDDFSRQWVNGQPTGHYSVSNISKPEVDSMLHGHLCSVRSLPRQDVDNFAFSNALKNSGKSRPRHARRLNESYNFDAGGAGVKNTTTRYGTTQQQQSSNREGTRDAKRRSTPHNNCDRTPVGVKTQDTYAFSSKTGMMRMTSPVKRPSPVNQPSPKKSTGQKACGNSKVQVKITEQKGLTNQERVPPPTILDDREIDSCQTSKHTHPSDTIEQITCLHDNKRIIKEVREFNRVFRDDTQETGGLPDDEKVGDDAEDRSRREHYNTLLQRKPKTIPDGIEETSQFKPSTGVRRSCDSLPERFVESEKTRSCSIRDIMRETKDVLHSRPSTIDAYRNDGARAQWTCTKWVDKMTTQVPKSTGWTCEVYSATCVNDADVGMATTDLYRSYIDARKNLATRENSLAKTEKLMSHSVDDNDEFECSSDDELAATMELKKKKPISLRRSQVRYEDTPNDPHIPNGELNQHQPMSNDDNNFGRNKMYEHPLQEGDDDLLKYKPKIFKKKYKHKNVGRKSEGKKLFEYKIRGKTLSQEQEQHLILTGMSRSESGHGIRQAINRPVRLSQMPDAFFKQAQTEPAKKFSTRLVDNNLCNVPKNAGCNPNETVVWDILPDGKCKVVSTPGSDDSSKLKTETVERDQAKSNVTIEASCKSNNESSPGRVTSMFKSAYEKLNPFAYYFSLRKPAKSNVEELFGGEENTSGNGNKAVELPVTRLFKAEDKDSVFANLNGSTDDYEAYELYKKARKQYEEEQAQRDSEFDIEDIPVDKKPFTEDESSEKRRKLVDESVQTTETHDNTITEPSSPPVNLQPEMKADEQAYYSTTHYLKRPSVLPGQSSPEDDSAFSSDGIFIEPRGVKAINLVQESPAKRKKSKTRKSPKSQSKSSKQSTSDFNIVDNKRATRKRKYRFSRSDSRQTLGDREKQNLSLLKSGPRERSPGESSSSGDSVNSPRRRINRSSSETLDSPLKCQKLTKSGKVKPMGSGGTRDRLGLEHKKIAKRTTSKVKKSSRTSKQQQIEDNFTAQSRYYPRKRSRTKSCVRKRDHSGTDTDPYSSLNTTELNSSIMRLYEEIHKLKRQLESVDDAFLQSTPRSMDRSSPESRLVFSPKSTPDKMPKLADSEGDFNFSDSPNPRLTPRSIENSSRESLLKHSDMVDNTTVSDKRRIKVQKSDHESQSLRLASGGKRSPKPLNQKEHDDEKSTQHQGNLKCRPDSPEKLRFKSIPQDTISLNKISSPLKMAGPCWGCWKNKHFNTGNKRYTKAKGEKFQAHGPPGSEDAWSRMESDEAVNSTRSDEDSWEGTASELRNSKDANPNFPGRTKFQSSHDVSVGSSSENQSNVKFSRSAAKPDEFVCSWRSPMEAFGEDYGPKSSLRDQQKNKASRGNIEKMVDDVHLLWTSASSPVQETPLGCSESIPTQNCSSSDTAYALSPKGSDRGVLSSLRNPIGDNTSASKYSSGETTSYASANQLITDSTPLSVDKQSVYEDSSVRPIQSSQQEIESRTFSDSILEDSGRVKQCNNTLGANQLVNNAHSYVYVSHLAPPSDARQSFNDAYSSNCCSPGSLIQQALCGPPRAPIVQDCAHKVYANQQASAETLEKIQANKKLSEFFQGKEVKVNDSETKLNPNATFFNRKQLIPQSIVCRKMKLFGSNQEAPLRFYTASVLKYPGENNNPQRRITSTTKSRNPNFPKEKHPRKESPNSFEKATQMETSDQSGNSFKGAQQTSSKKQKSNPGPAISNYEHTASKPTAPTTRAGSQNIAQASTRQNARNTMNSIERNAEEIEKQISNNEQLIEEENKYSQSNGNERYILLEENKKRERQYAETPYEKIMELIIDKSSHQDPKNSDKKEDNMMESPEPTYRIEITKSPTKRAIRKVFEPDENYSEFKERNAAEVLTPKSVSHTLCSLEEAPSNLLQSTSEDIFQYSNVTAPLYNSKGKNVNNMHLETAQRQGSDSFVTNDRKTKTRPHEKNTAHPSNERNITLSISGLDQPEHRELSSGDYSSQPIEQFTKKGIKLDPDKGIKLEYPEQGIQLQVHMYERYTETQSEFNTPPKGCQSDGRYKEEYRKSHDENVAGGPFNGQSTANMTKHDPPEELKTEIFDRMEFIATNLGKPKSYRIQNIDPLVSKHQGLDCVSRTFPHAVVNADSRLDPKTFDDGSLLVPEARISHASSSRGSELSIDASFKKYQDSTINESGSGPFPWESGDQKSNSPTSSQDWQRLWCDTVIEGGVSPDPMPTQNKPQRTRLRSHKKHVAHTGCEKLRREPLIPKDVSNECLQYDMGTANNNSNVTPSSEDDKEKHEDSPEIKSKENDKTPNHESSSEFISILPQNLSYISGRKTRRLATSRGRVSPLCSRQSIASLNLVDCVKDIFFQSHRPDVSNAQGESKIHTCPPQRTPRLETPRKLYIKSMDGNGTFDYMLSPSSCEEAINGGYIEKRRSSKKVTHELENGKYAMSTTPSQCSNYTTKSGQSKTQAASLTQGTGKTNARSHSSERHSSETALSDYTGPYGLGGTNSCTSQYKKVCIASELSQCSQLQERNALVKTNGLLTTEDNGGGSERTQLPFHQAEDSNKILTHYSDAIKKRNKRSSATESASQPLHTDQYNVDHWNNDCKDLNSDGFALRDSFRVSTMFSPFCFKSDSDSGRDSRLSGGSYYQDPGNNIMSSFEQMMQDKRPCYAEQCGFRTKAHRKKNASHGNRSFSEELKATPCLGIPQSTRMSSEGSGIKLDKCSNETVNDSQNCVSETSEKWCEDKSGINCLDTSAHNIDEDITLLKASLSFSEAARALGGLDQERSASNNNGTSSTVFGGDYMEESESDDGEIEVRVKDKGSDHCEQSTAERQDDEIKHEVEGQVDEQDAEDVLGNEANVEESVSFNNDARCDDEYITASDISCDSNISCDSCDTCDSDASSDSAGSLCANGDSSDNGGGCTNEDCVNDASWDSDGSCDSDVSCDCKGNDNEAARQSDDTTGEDDV